MPDEDKLFFGALNQNGLQIHSVEPRHPTIRQRSRVLFARENDAVVSGAQPRHPFDRCVVIDQKYRLFEESCRRSVGRKNKFKPSATTISIFSCDRAAVRFNNRTHNSQAHSQPFVFRS